MKMFKKDDGSSMFVSEGKLLEVMPIITDGTGQPMMLPPAVWPVEGWVLGFTDARHITGTPFTLWMPMHSEIPGSTANASHRIAFIVRILEDSPAPPRTGTIDPEAIKEALKIYREAFHQERLR